nr:putative late blight resistance protein homolog R1A-4 isoform X1 [Ipomoea batatas]
MFSAESEDLLASTRTCVFPVAILLATTLSENKFEDVGFTTARSYELVAFSDVIVKADIQQESDEAHSKSAHCLGFLPFLTRTDAARGKGKQNLKNLQTVIVCGGEPQLRTGHFHLSFRIWELPHLRHLELGNYYEVDPPNRNIEQLQTLSWVSPTHFTGEVYRKFPNLKYLKVFYKGAFEPCSSPGSCRNPTINLDYIRCLSKLETLTVIVPANSMTHLEQPVFSAGLKKLRLSGTNLPIMKLPWVLRALKVLKLENAFSGQMWGSFEQFSNLKVLLIEATNLQKWEVRCSADFPKLKCLILRRCYCLEEIPVGVSFIDTLETIKVEQCPPCVVTSAMKIQEKRKWLRKEANNPGEAYSIRRARLIRVDAFLTPLTIVVDNIGVEGEHARVVEFIRNGSGDESHDVFVLEADICSIVKKDVKKEQRRGYRYLLNMVVWSMEKPMQKKPCWRSKKLVGGAAVQASGTVREAAVQAWPCMLGVSKMLAVQVVYQSPPPSYLQCPCPSSINP